MPLTVISIIEPLILNPFNSMRWEKDGGIGLTIAGDRDERPIEVVHFGIDQQAVKLVFRSGKEVDDVHETVGHDAIPEYLIEGAGQFAVMEAARVMLEAGGGNQFHRRGIEDMKTVQAQGFGQSA